MEDNLNSKQEHRKHPLAPKHSKSHCNLELWPMTLKINRLLNLSIYKICNKLTWAPSKDVRVTTRILQMDIQIDNPLSISTSQLHWWGNNMYLLTGWEGRTRNYLAQGQDVWTERSEVDTSWPWAKYFPIRPDLTQSISIFSYDHLVSKIVKNLFEPK